MKWNAQVNQLKKKLSKKFQNYSLVLEYIEIRPEKQVWTDDGSKAAHEVSFWSLSESQINAKSNFKLLGDTVCNQRTVCQNIVMVKDISTAQNVLEAPLDSELVWKDLGSGATANLAIYRLTPPSGYKCLGYAIVGWPLGTQTHSPPELRRVSKLMLI